MALYYKGMVRQVTDEASTLTWGTPIFWRRNELKQTSLAEVDADLDTSRFHISLPILGKEFYIVDGKEYAANAGEYFIFNPKQEALAVGKFKKNVEGYCLFITEETMLAAAQHLYLPIEKTLDSPFYFPWQQQEFVIKNYHLQENSFGKYLARLRQKLMTATEGQPIDWDSFYFELAIEFLSAHRQIGQHLQAIPSVSTLTKQEIYRRLSMAHCYILEKYSDDISLEDLEGVAFFSKYHIVRLYHKIYGLTPYQHILKLRVEKAKELLQKEFSPTEVAEQLSFSDRRAFAKTFKKMVGVAPSQFAQI